MFTGLVETIGTVLDYSKHDDSSTGGDGVSITIGNCSEILEDVKLGDSISTNGVCLTVTEFNLGKTLFKVGVAPETLRRTNLGDLKHGAPVNLERAVTSEVRLGGHIVQGHVDTIAKIVDKKPDGNAIAYTFELRDKEFINYIVHKGFIAIDGASLTVTNVDPSKVQFSIMLISYSQEKVILAKKEVGDTVNIEVDLTGIKVSDGTLIATSKAATRGISILKDTDDKTRHLNAHNLIAYTGEAGDTVQFAEYVQANIQLYSMRENDIELSPKATASFVRNQLASSLRSRKPYQVNCLIGGYDVKKNEPSLNWIDYLGTQVELPYGAHGYAAFYTTSLLDKHYRKDMTVEDGLKLMDMCVKELQTRMPIDFKGVYIKVVDKDGIRQIESN